MFRGSHSVHRRQLLTRRQWFARWTAAIAYIYLALGISLPIPSGMISAEAFPCMNHQCGCRTAEQCWHNCCCMSLFDKLEWARENHITPPDYVLAEAELRGIQWHAFCLHAYDETDSTCSCCRAQSLVCTDSHCTKRSRAAQGIVLIEALKCSGAGDTWHGMSVSLPPPSEVSLAFANAPIEWTCSIPLSFSTISFPPDLPPPRSTIG